jgi:hypothetical protein
MFEHPRRNAMADTSRQPTATETERVIAGIWCEVLGPARGGNDLDRMLITGERHLRLVLGEYVEHYNVHRPHRTLSQSPPGGRDHPPATDPSVRVLRWDRLGGLIREYAQVA